jgi:hypothetical protein
MEIYCKSCGIQEKLVKNLCKKCYDKKIYNNKQDEILSQKNNIIIITLIKLKNIEKITEKF